MFIRDRVYSDVMLVIFTLLMVFMGKVISGVKNQHFDYASLIMTAGTFTSVSYTHLVVRASMFPWFLRILE